jgi:uncharacterized pyridoxamine 5'-phosphate oxidase family protein
VYLAVFVTVTVFIGCRLKSDIQQTPVAFKWDEVFVKDGLSMKDVHDFLKECGVYYLATVDGDQPRVRPFGSAAIYENKLYILTGKSKNVGKQLMLNPKVEICAYDQKSSVWLRIETTLTADERIEVKQFVIDEHPSVSAMYSADDDNTFTLYLTDAIATFTSFKGDSTVVKF